MPEFNKIEEITNQLKQYMILNLELVKLRATERASALGSSLFSSLIIGLSIFLFVFTLSLGLGFYLSALMDNTYSGFVIIAGFYLLLAVILFAGRKKMIQKPMRDKIIQQLLKSN